MTSINGMGNAIEIILSVCAVSHDLILDPCVNVPNVYMYPAASHFLLAVKTMTKTQQFFRTKQKRS